MQRTYDKNYDYTPYGKILWQDNNNDERHSFLGKEKDEESDLGDYGVRKYDDLTGRFTATDPLWEKYYGLNTNNNVKSYVLIILRIKLRYANNFDVSRNNY